MPPKSTEAFERASSAFPTWVAIGVLVALISIWSTAVNSAVPDPYLVGTNILYGGDDSFTKNMDQDEVFHVRQAQTYIAGNLLEWDPKITTPPGL